MLGMYDMPAIQRANDRYWQAIRARLGEGPSRLTRDADPWDMWRAPELLFAQTCGMPYRTKLIGRVARIGTPDYGLPDCAPGYYRSVIVVRADFDGALGDLDGRRLAFNEPLSQSGWAGPVTWLSGRGITPGALLQTGAHAASVRAVAEGRADFAGIDAVTFALLQEHDPLAARVRVIGHTDAVPGLPYITALTRDAEAFAEAVRGAIADLAPADRAALHLRGLVEIDDAAYLAVPTPAPPGA